MKLLSSHPRTNKYKSIYWQNFVLTAIVVLFTLVLLGTAFFSVSYSYTFREQSRAMEERASIVSHTITEYMDNGSFPDMQKLTRFASNMTNIDFLVCSRDGEILFCTDETLKIENKSVPARIFSAVEEDGHDVSRGTLGGLFPKKRLITAVPLSFRMQTVGMVLAVMPLDTVSHIWGAMFMRFLLLAALALFIAVLASFWVSRKQTKPILEMAEATRQFADGAFDVRMRNYGVGEIGELANSFNHMADSLEETERQRRELIANVSHELKTPMTTIAGYTDGILDGTIPPEQEKQYLRIISQESRRLSRLVRRMLDISQLQSRDAARNMHPFDLCESMRRVLISLEEKIRSKNLDVDAVIPEDAVNVFGDVDLITQVIYNLLENAVKFATPDSTLGFSLGISGTKAVVSVRNEGETIPPEEIPLLFERFHKSDKSRSMDKDGVGLGLYIVQTILKQHHEQIAVTSENGVTTFAFTMQLTAK